MILSSAMANSTVAHFFLFCLLNIQYMFLHICEDCIKDYKDHNS